MSAEQTRRVLELNMPLPLDRIFEQIDLRQCLGSATISQASQQLHTQNGLFRLHLWQREVSSCQSSQAEKGGQALFHSS